MKELIVSVWFWFRMLLSIPLGVLRMIIMFFGLFVSKRFLTNMRKHFRLSR